MAGSGRQIQFKRLNIAGLENVAQKVGDLVDNSSVTYEIMQSLLEGINAGEYTPYKTGQLQYSAVVTPRQIEYNAYSSPKEGTPYNYANKVYWGTELNFNTTYNSRATAVWDRAYMADNQEEFSERIKQIIVNSLDK